jgi:hypothetical protein
MQDQRRRRQRAQTTIDLTEAQEQHGGIAILYRSIAWRLGPGIITTSTGVLYGLIMASQPTKYTVHYLQYYDTALYRTSMNMNNNELQSHSNVRII